MSTPDTTAAYLRPRDLAELLGLTPRTLCRWRKEGRGPAYVRDGKTIRYRTDDLDAWGRTSH